jgi:hypothetical protein
VTDSLPVNRSSIDVVFALEYQSMSNSGSPTANLANIRNMLQESLRSSSPFLLLLLAPHLDLLPLLSSLSFSFSAITGLFKISNAYTRVGVVFQGSLVQPLTNNSAYVASAISGLTLPPYGPLNYERALQGCNSAYTQGSDSLLWSASRVKICVLIANANSTRDGTAVARAMKYNMNRIITFGYIDNGISLHDLHRLATQQNVRALCFLPCFCCF